MPPVSAAKIAVCQLGVLLAVTAVVAVAPGEGDAVVVTPAGGSAVVVCSAFVVGTAVVVDKEGAATWAVVGAAVGLE
jgi:hypothetical protein